MYTYRANLDNPSVLRIKRQIYGHFMCQDTQKTLFKPVEVDMIFSTASGALVVGGVRDICMYVVSKPSPEIALSVQWSRTNQSVAVCGSLW